MSEEPPIRIAIVDDHKMLLGALTEWIRNAADDIRMVAAVASWPELLTHPEFPVDVVLLDLDLKDNIPISLKLSTLKTTGVATVLMSTYSEPAVVREAPAAGAMADRAILLEIILGFGEGHLCAGMPERSAREHECQGGEKFFHGQIGVAL